jgi:DNA-directed RNA polymerase specialized sigma24 family protein
VIDLDVHHRGIALHDEDAFARWLAGAERPLRLSLRSFAAAVDTEAVLQETLLRVWVAASRCEPDGLPNSLLRFARRIAMNLALDQVRRRGAAAPPDPPGDDEVPVPAPPPDPILRARIRECLERLPRAPRRAIGERLAAQGGLRDADLAARLGMRLNTFLQNVGRARRLLADCLRRAGVQVPA